MNPGFRPVCQITVYYRNVSKALNFLLICQVKEDTDLFIVDEVGKMELFSSAFFPAVMRVMESNIPVLATIPLPRYGRDIPGGTIFPNLGA